MSAGGDQHDPIPEHAPATLGLVELAVLVGVLFVAATSTWSLALAQLGRHDGVVALGLGVVTTGAGLAAASAKGRRPQLATDRTELVLGGLVVLVGLAMFLPGAPYEYGDKDPGVYVTHAFAIAREGDVRIPDRVLERVDQPTLLSAGTRYPGYWIETDAPTEVTPQFYHLYPATMATAIDVVGPVGAWSLNPMLAILAVLAVALAVRRGAGTTAAALAAGLLLLSMMEVWQAKYPTTEILAQVLLAGAVLGAVVSLSTRWVGATAIAGVAVGTGFLARPDGFLYVLMALAIAAVVIAAGWWDRRTGWFLGGVALTLPYALVNAYAIRELYTFDNGVPRLRVLAAVVVVLGILTAILHRTGWLRGLGRLSDRAMTIVGVLGALAIAAVLFLAQFREDLFGIDYTYFGLRKIRSYDELNLIWLSYFFTKVGLALMWLGLLLVLVRRWRPSLLLLLGPGMALLPLYLYEAKISPRLMWWVRRWIPGIVPAIAIAIAIVLAWAIGHRNRPLRAAGIVVAVALLAVFAHQSLPLRAHREMAGSTTLIADVASLVDGPDDGVLLFTWPADDDFSGPTRNLPGPIWFVEDRTTALLPETPSMADVETYTKAFPDEPIFVLSSDDTLPAGIDADRFERVKTFDAVLSRWEEAIDHRPDHDVPFSQHLVAWRYLG